MYPLPHNHMAASYSYAAAWSSSPPSPNPNASSSSSSSSSSSCSSLLPQHQQQPTFHAMDSHHHQHNQQQQQISPRPLQGPRPAPLKVRKDSYKIKKPPAGPGASHPPAPAAAVQQPQQQQQQRQPVIIYTVSPRVIHVKPSEFMNLVQSLTGVNSSPTAAERAAAASALSPPGFPSPTGAVSPAARLATIEKAQQASGHSSKQRPSSDDLDIIDQFDASGGVAAALDRPPNFMGILSPNPSMLPAIPSNLFSSTPGPELNSLGFLQDMMSNMSPAVAGNRNYVDSSFLISPQPFSYNQTAPSPSTTYWQDLFSSPQKPFDYLYPFPDP